MTTQFIQFPTPAAIPTYTTFSAFPALASDGSPAIALDTDVLYIFNLGSATWLPSGGPSVLLSIGALDGQAANAQGAAASGGVLYLQSADNTHPGLVNTATQTFAGNKTFSGTIGASNLSGTNTGDVSLAAVGSAPSANGASLSGQVLTLQPADGTHPGLLTISAQTIAGAKTFSTAPILSSLTASLPLQLDASKNIISTAIDLSGSQAAGILAAARFPALTGDVTTSAAALATTVAKIQGTTVSGTTGTVNAVFSSAPTLTNPVVGTQSQGNASTLAASTAYVDTAVANAVAGVNPALAVQAATTGAANTSAWGYLNGVSGVGATFTGPNNTVIVIDGYTFNAVGQRILIKDDTQSPSGAFNGIYFVSVLQTGITGCIFTRALDYDTPTDMNNTGSIPVVNGTVNGTTSWVLTSAIATVGTSPLTFTKFTRNPADYLLVANNLSDVNSKSTSFNNLSPMTTGGDLIYGGASGVGTRLANGSANQMLQSAGGTSAPAWSNVSGTNFVNQSANLIFGGPASGSAAAPTFRTQVVADLPLNVGPINDLLNSSFDIWQLGTTTTCVSGSTRTYISDQWYVFNNLGTNGVITGSQVAGTNNGAKYGCQIQITTAPTGSQINSCYILQVLDNLTSLKYYNGTGSVTCRIKALGNVTSVTIALYYATSEVKLNSSLSSTNVTVNSSTFTTVTLNNVSMGNTWTTSGVVGMGVNINGVSSGNAYDLNNGFIIEQATMNVGANANLNFVRNGNNTQAELSSCQRFLYLPDYVGSSSGQIGCGQASGVTTAQISVPFPVPMRIAPSLTVNNPTKFQVFNAGITVNLAASAFSLNAASITGALLNVTVATGLVAGNAALLTRYTDTTGQIIFDARI